MTESFHEQALFKTISDEELVEYLKESMLDTYIHKNTKIQLIEDNVPIIESKKLKEIINSFIVE